MSDDIPHWAKKRACELANGEGGSAVCWRPSHVGEFALLTALARYIAEHEDTPVDPDLIKAREICARVTEEWWGGQNQVVNYRYGTYDTDPEVQFALTALKEARNA